MSVRGMPTWCSGSQFDKVPRTLGVGFCPCTRLYRADAAALLRPLLFMHVRAHKFTDTGCNVRVRACTCMSGFYTLSKTSWGSIFALARVPGAPMHPRSLTD